MGPALLRALLKSLTLGAAEVGAPPIRTLRPLALISLTLKLIRALTVTNLAIGVGSVPYVRTGQGKKLVFNLS